jgi:hypothetical protein
MATSGAITRSSAQQISALLLALSQGFVLIQAIPSLRFKKLAARPDVWTVRVNSDVRPQAEDRATQSAGSGSAITTSSTTYSGN